jgi:hypothetical protein
MDGVTWGRRFLEAAVSARERTEAAGEDEHE